MLEELQQGSKHHEKTKPFGLIYPDAVERAVWDISLFVAIIYQSMSLPFKIAFEVRDYEFMFWFEMTVDIMFIVDIVLNFNTGYHEKSRLILSRSKIFKQYFFSWFWVDLVSSCPYTWILAWSQGISIRALENNDGSAISA